MELARKMLDKRISGCKRMFWENSNAEALIKEQFGEYLDLFQHYEYSISKADFARHCVLYSHGGLYADLSFKIIGSVNKLLHKYRSFNVLFFIETILTDAIIKDPAFKKARAIRKRALELGFIETEEEHPVRLFSSLIFSRKTKHPIFTEMVKEAKKRSIFPMQSAYDIIFTTGPALVTHVVHKNIKTMKDIGIVPMEDWKKTFASVRNRKTNSQWRDELSRKYGH